MSLVSLPTEMLVEVAQRLDSATELANFTLSAQFARAAAAQHEVVIWRALTLKRWPAAESSVVAAMGLTWKARYRHYHERAERDRLLALHSRQLTVAEINEQFTFFIESHSDSRDWMVRSNVGEAATTLRAVVSEDGYQQYEPHRWSLTTDKDVAADGVGPELEIFVLRHADNALASFVELTVSDENLFEVYARWYSSNNHDWCPGLQRASPHSAQRRACSPFALLCTGKGYGGERIMAFSGIDHGEFDGSLTPPSDRDLDAPYKIHFECDRMEDSGDSRFDFGLDDLSDLLTRTVGGLHWKVYE